MRLVPQLIYNSVNICGFSGLVENATVAACTIARRWAKMIHPGDRVLVFDLAYAANLNILSEYCVAAGAEIEVIRVPFPVQSKDQILEAVEAELRRIGRSGQRAPRFAMLDHISSQPAIKLPIREITELVRNAGTANMEIAIDGAHSVGSCSFDIREVDCDWFFTNLHNWGFAPIASTLIHARSMDMAKETHHPVTSWYWEGGLPSECRFTGTRDYSALLAVPAAASYLQAWRSPLGETSWDYSHRMVLDAARMLTSAWGTELTTREELVSTQAMVPLPPDLRVTDVPGQPSAGLRATLRERFKIEAATGNFGPDIGSFIRLSFGVYNTMEEIERLRDAILLLREEAHVV